MDRKNDFHVKDSNSGPQKGPTPTLQHLLYQVLSTEMDSTQKDHFYILTSIEDIGRDGLTALLEVVMQLLEMDRESLQLQKLISKSWLTAQRTASWAMATTANTVYLRVMTWRRFRPICTTSTERCHDFIVTRLIGTFWLTKYWSAQAVEIWALHFSGVIARQIWRQAAATCTTAAAGVHRKLRLARIISRILRVAFNWTSFTIGFRHKTCHFPRWRGRQEIQINVN